MGAATQTAIRRGQANAVAVWTAVESLWAETQGDSRVIVAIIDGPVDQSHPCFNGANLTRLPTLVTDASDTGAACRHGTHIASIIFGHHDSPVRGIAPACRGLLLSVFTDGPRDSIAPCSQIDLARAITQAVESGAKIINISGGQLEPSGEPHEFLAKAVRTAADEGALIVASAGNDGCECLHVPAASELVLAVGAMQHDGSPLDSSNWGSSYSSHGILAPGVNISGAVPGGGITSANGTSFATAVVSGVAALLLSLQLKRGQEPDTQAVKAAILETAIGCERWPVSDCRRILSGRLNLAGAMAQSLEGGNEMSERAQNSLTTTDEATTALSANVRAATSESGSSRPASESTERVIDTTERTEAEGNSPAGNQAAVAPSECSCRRCSSIGGGGSAPPQLVYALGQLGYDFGTEARRDSISQRMGRGADPYNPDELLAYLEKNPSDAAAILWTLNLDATSIYAIQGHGPFASEVYGRLREFLKAQIDPEQRAERISVPGYIMGSVRLLNGQVVPVIWPELRGMFNWTTGALVNAVCGKRPSKEGKGQETDAYMRKCEGVRNFLERVYHELRNLGTTSRERAINFSASNAFNITRTFELALKEGLDLDTIEVERSPLCRPESDCWDLKLTFFNPSKVFEQARKVYRFTVDVSDVVPVTVGAVRSWFVR